MEDCKDNYDDIINYEYKGSKTRRHMPRADRAAQFAPYAALKGYEEVINETAELSQNEDIIKTE